MLSIGVILALISYISETPMTEPPFTRTVLMIGGHDFDPAELTAVVGIQPSHVRRQKHEWLRVAAPELASLCWEYEHRRQRVWTLGEAIEDVVCLFWDKRQALLDYVSRHSLRVELRCIPSGDASTMIFAVQPEVLSRLAELKATLSLAFYQR